MRRALLFVTTIALLGAALAPLGVAAASPKFDKGGQFIVQMKDMPVVAYDGSINGLKATKPAPGTKINPNSAAVVKYTDYLKTSHNRALTRAGGGNKLYDYFYSYNGFLAKLTAGQANKLAADAAVQSIVRNERVEADTSSTPAFLGLSDTGGLWQQLGGPTGTKTVAGAGENIVIGIVDSGIWPESLSFSDRNASGQLIYGNLPGWSFNGKCDSAEKTIDDNWDADKCNKKLVAARHFNASWGGDAALEAERPWEFQSPRDYNGHGTHTASTAGGNHGVAATGDSALFGSISGMAPRARIATYKALWSTEDASTASGFTGDLVAAIDQAVADGVDVINYSISGTVTNFADPAQIAFLFAANAGVFVSASAGNSGPATSTVAHPGPWLTTVAAGTHNRSGNGSVTLGNGSTYNGKSLTNGVGPVPIINATAAGLPGATPNLLRQCFSESAAGGTPQLDPALVAGKIVVCERGGTAPANARVDKSAAVAEAGGVGIVIYNVGTSTSLNADLHTIPAVHINNADGTAVAAYAATSGATATIAQATVVLNEPAPTTAGFSSRGPALAAGGDILKPDVIAPGQDILAAVAPPGNGGRDFNIYSGTSMSAPHVAGLAALLKQAHPSWSPMAIKSALMTSAYDVLDGPNTNPLVIFRQGAGHVRPNSATDPGLVYDAGWLDWLAFLCGTSSAVGPSTCNTLIGLGYSTDASNLNVASIAIGDMAGVQTVTRKVKNVGGSAATYNASYTGLAGFNVNISPNQLTLNPGQVGTFTVTFTTTSATLNAYQGGQLTWTQTGASPHVVRIPMVIKPVALAAPAEVSGTGGNIQYSVKFGYTGPFTATPRGLIPAAVTPGTVAQDPDQSFTACADPQPGVVKIPVVVPAGSSYARFSLFDADVDAGSDIDLYVCNGTTLVGSSGGGSSAEQVNLVNPAAATYDVFVHGWGVANGVSSPFKLYAWVLGTTDAGNMTVSAPASATLGTTDTITLSFSGLAPNTRYLGSVAYSGAAGMPNPTIVRVDTP